jgi:hypothetical protein
VPAQNVPIGAIHAAIRMTLIAVQNGGSRVPYPRPAVTVRDVAGYHHDHAPIGAAKVVADVVYVAVYQQPPDRRTVGQQGWAYAVGAMSPHGHSKLRTGAPGAGG